MQEEYSKKWDKCLEIIRDIVPPEQFKSWFSPLTFLRVENDILTIYCPTEFFAEQLEERYIGVLGKTLKRVFGPSIRLIYECPIVANDPSTQVAVGSAHPSPAVKPIPGATSNPFKEVVVEDIDSQLNPDYTFENYCISHSNRGARSIGEAIANDPKLQTFNPLFVFGPCGVGKTHLIQAIGIRIKERNPRARVLYITARLFESKTQKISYHIFNHLKQNHRQLIMSSDCCPSQMEGMQDRLLSRFKSGMTAQLEKPDFELRRDVLTQKALRDGLQLPSEVMDFIASNVTDSIRELEGVVVSLLAHATFLDKDISVELARRVLSNSVKLNKRTVNFETITRRVSEFYDIEPDQIFTKSRKREVSDARQMVMYLAKKHTKMPLKAIGTRLSRTHATVLYACRLIGERLAIEKKLQDDIAKIESELLSV